jgi:hypothetical protein
MPHYFAHKSKINKSDISMSSSNNKTIVQARLPERLRRIYWTWDNECCTQEANKVKVCPAYQLKKKQASSFPWTLLGWLQGQEPFHWISRHSCSVTVVEVFIWGFDLFSSFAFPTQKGNGHIFRTKCLHIRSNNFGNTFSYIWSGSIGEMLWASRNIYK